jgi:hypothetical protein
MGMGSEGGGGIGAGAEGSTGLSALGALGGGGASGGGSAGGIQAFLQDPKNIQLLGQIMQQGSRLSQLTGKLPPDAKQFFTAAMARSLTAQSGGPGGAVALGTMQPQSSPYVGDISGYSIDPQLARSVLSRMGVM